jgi:predicted oxidoreductase
MLTALRERDRVRANAAAELAVPPQAILLGMNAAACVASAALRARPAARAAGVALGGQVLFVLGGLALVRAPARVYAALALAPLLVVRKAALLTRVARREPAAWVRTPR